MSYRCKTCEKIFNYEYLLIRHSKRKRPCKKKNTIDDYIINLTTNNNLNGDLQNDLDDSSDNNIENNIDSKIKLLEDKIKFIDDNINKIYTDSLNNTSICNFCNKKFDVKGNLKRHMNIACIERKNQLNKKEPFIKDRDMLINEKNEIQKEKEIIERFLKNNNLNNNNSKNKNSKINNTTNNNNITNNINVNLMINNINPFGKEDISHITPSEYKKILSSFFPGFIDFIKKIHFDDRMPSNQNVYIPKIDSKYVCVFEDNQWNMKKKGEIVDKIITNKRKLLNNKCDELFNSGTIDDNIVELHEEFNKNYYEGGTDTEKYISEDIELLLYNYKNKITDKKDEKLIK
jgi:hypothetical protein